MKYKIYIDREELKIHYFDPITMVSEKIIKFNTIEELENYIYNKQSA